MSPYSPDSGTALPAEWLFEAVFDYGEHDRLAPTPDDSLRPWPVRQDAFSSYRAGFDIRTYRLCRRVLMFHHFPGEPTVGDSLVRSTDLSYSESPIASFITSVTQSGYVRRPDGTYLKDLLPAIEFTYSEATVDETVRTVDAESEQNLPYGLDGVRYRWVDLDSEGASGILTEQGEGWYYKRNLSPSNIKRENGAQRAIARFAPAELVGRMPTLADLRGGRQQLLDLAGDGHLALVQFDDPLPGYYARTDDGDWKIFSPSTPSRTSPGTTPT